MYLYKNILSDWPSKSDSNEYGSNIDYTVILDPVRWGREFFSSALHQEQLWGPPSLISTRYQGFFPGG
jgi:hypothetical protein